MNALQATLASFLGCASFVLANSIAQGLWLWKEGRIGQGCALLLAEFGNPIPHHLGKFRLPSFWLWIKLICLLLDCLLHLWDTRQERSYTYAATSKISSHSFTSKPLQLPQQSVIGSSRHSRNSGTFVVPTSSKKSLSIDTAAVPSPTSARNICLPSPPLQTYIYTTRVRWSAYREVSWWLRVVLVGFVHWIEVQPDRRRASCHNSPSWCPRVLDIPT